VRKGFPGIREFYVDAGEVDEFAIAGGDREKTTRKPPFAGVIMPA
jgi:hypothetical protein